MTAATLIELFDNFVPGMEVVRLEVTDGETYLAKKLSVITAAVASGNEDQDAHINVTWSGSTVTINYASMSDKDITLWLFGRP